MRSHMNTLFSAKVGTILVISHKRSLYLSVCLSSSHWFEVGEAQLEKGDVAYFRAPIVEFSDSCEIVWLQTQS